MTTKTKSESTGGNRDVGKLSIVEDERAEKREQGERTLPASEIPAKGSLHHPANEDLSFQESVSFRQPARWVKPKPIEPFPVYPVHFITCRAEPFVENIAQMINYAAELIARGETPKVESFSSFPYIVGDCDHEVIKAALKEYDPNRSEVAAVRDAFERLDEVRCGPCGTSHRFHQAHRCPEGSR